MKNNFVFLLCFASIFLLLPACKKEKCKTTYSWQDGSATYDSENECERKSAGTCSKVSRINCG